MSQAVTQPPIGFVDRRLSESAIVPPIMERRQFANSYDDLSPPARELAKAIDEYKLRHRRRFISCEELLGVIQQLGYKQS
jgi:hypothetical protein